MDNFREIKNTLTWHNEGKFTAELVNGVITKLNFCEPGTGPEHTGKSLTSINFKYLHAVYLCLGDLFNFIEEENKRLGYSYSNEVQMPQLNEEDIIKNYNMPVESRMLSLINYDRGPVLSKPDTEQKVLRDIG